MIGAEFQNKIIPLCKRHVFLYPVWSEKNHLSFMGQTQGEVALGGKYSWVSKYRLSIDWILVLTKSLLYTLWHIGSKLRSLSGCISRYLKICNAFSKWPVRGKARKFESNETSNAILIFPGSTIHRIIPLSFWKQVVLSSSHSTDVSN